MSGGSPANYDFLIQRALNIQSAEQPLVLEYGCGRGRLIQRALDQGLDIVGCDTFAGAYEENLERALAPAERLKKMDGAKIPFNDNHFDMVVSNQVFEHVENFEEAFAEVHRVLKPGGVFCALFPIKNTWREAHAHLYFVHYLQDRPSLQFRYLKGLKRLGFSKTSGGQNKPPHEWAEYMQGILQKSCFYHSFKDVKQAAERIFKADFQDIGAEFLAYRGQRFHLDDFRKGPQRPIIDAIYRFITIKRAGIAFSITKK